MNEDERLELRGLKLDWDARRTERALARVQTRVVRERGAWRAVIAGSAVAAALSIGIFAHHRIGEVEVAPTAAQAALKLRDGSEVSATSAFTEFHVAEESASRVLVQLGRGAVRCQVLPKPARAFVVQAGEVSVAVVGTEFVVERRGSSAWVSVARGKVRVSWGEGDALLTAGQSGLFPRSGSPGEALTAPEARLDGDLRGDGPRDSGDRDRETRNGESPDDRASEDRAAPAERAQQARQMYRSHVARRDYPGAFAVLSHNPVLAGDTVEELLVAADVARLSNHPAQAVPYLQRILREHGRDERAPMAAFTLGRTLSGLGRTREAMNTFGRVRSAWPGSPLGEDALVRQAEAAAKLGDRPAAARLAAQYDREYPKGRRRAEVRGFAGLE